MYQITTVILVITFSFVAYGAETVRSSVTGGRETVSNSSFWKDHICWMKGEAGKSTPLDIESSTEPPPLGCGPIEDTDAVARAYLKLESKTAKPVKVCFTLVGFVSADSSKLIEAIDGRLVSDGVKRSHLPKGTEYVFKTKESIVEIAAQKDEGSAKKSIVDRFKSQSQCDKIKAIQPICSEYFNEDVLDYFNNRGYIARARKGEVVSVPSVRFVRTFDPKLNSKLSKIWNSLDADKAGAELHTTTACNTRK